MLDNASLQKILSDKGVYSGGIDGKIGPKTIAGLMAIAAGIGTIPVLAQPLANSIDSIRLIYDISTPLRLIHFLAQGCVETAWWRTLEEYGDDAYFAKYDAGTSIGKMLGNTQPGDGAKYKGRGLLMTTGRANYQAAANRTKLDLVNNPEMVASPATASLCACIFWCDNHLNRQADADDVDGVTAAINGGLNGLPDRKIATGRLKSIWGMQ